MEKLKLQSSLTIRENLILKPTVHIHFIVQQLGDSKAVTTLHEVPQIQLEPYEDTSNGCAITIVSGGH